MPLVPQQAPKARAKRPAPSGRRLILGDDVADATGAERRGERQGRVDEPRRRHGDVGRVREDADVVRPGRVALVPTVSHRAVRRGEERLGVEGVGPHVLLAETVFGFQPLKIS